MAIRSAEIMGLGSLAIAERKAEQAGAPVYYYNLAYRSTLKLPGMDADAGPMHAIDIPLVFDNPGPGAVLLGDRPDRAEAARHMSQFWTSFARTSRPAADGQPAWRPYTLNDRAAMVIDVDCSLVVDRWGAERKAWEKLPPG
jgi:para-nitrobenzyl esterase